MKSIVLATLLLATPAQAILFQWTPAEPQWQNRGADASLSSGFIDFSGPVGNSWAGFTLDRVLAFSFDFGDGTPVFTDLSRIWNLYSNGAKLTSPEGNAGFTGSAADWQLRVDFDSLNNPMGNSFISARQGDTDFPMLCGRWLRNDAVPDSGNTAGLLALAGLGLALARCRHRL